MSRAETQRRREGIKELLLQKRLAPDFGFPASLRPGLSGVYFRVNYEKKMSRAETQKRREGIRELLLQKRLAPDFGFPASLRPCARRALLIILSCPGEKEACLACPLIKDSGDRIFFASLCVGA